MKPQLRKLWREVTDTEDTGNKVIEAEAALEYASEAAVVEEALEEAEELKEEQLCEETLNSCCC